MPVSHPVPREPVHPQEPPLPPGPTLAWRRRRRRLASGCRYWSLVSPSMGGDPRLSIAADALDDERDLVVAFTPLAKWFGLDPSSGGSWSTEAMLARASSPRQDRVPADPYAVLTPDWSKIPPGQKPDDALYVAHLTDGPTELRLVKERDTGDWLPGLHWQNQVESGVVPVRSSLRLQRSDRMAWWDWLYVRAIHLAYRQAGRRVALSALDALVLPGLPWRTT